MKEIQLFLVPQPGSKPEFLATCIPVDPAPLTCKLWEQLPTKIVLEAYTRDGWAWKPCPSLTTFPVKSVDGRNKLPGFVNYLTERKKSAVGRFSGGGVWVVSYIQQTKKEPNKMDCRVSMDLTKIPNCNLKPQSLPPSSTSSSSQSKSQQEQPQSNKPAATARKAGGLLGKLVGAQQRTNQHLISTSKVSTAKQPLSNPAAAAAVSGDSDGQADLSPAATSATLGDTTQQPTSSQPSTAVFRTPQQVFSEFRQSMQDKMLDFDMAENDEVLQITVTLAEHTAGLATEDKPKVTMEVLKYMVYEAAEEVNEEWIAFKEPSEFMDEAIFSIYKEGAAPPEVLEEINQGELPEEIRAQQRAIASERQRQANQANSQQQRKVMQQAHQLDEVENLEVLNQRKRDRRTIEDYERDKRDNAKRSR